MSVTPVNPLAMAKKSPRGMVISAYLNHKDLGSGERVFLVMGLHEGWVSLYYPPYLYKFRLTPTEWENLRAVPIHIDRCAMAGRITDLMRVYRKYNLRFSEHNAERAMELLGPC